jgi:hypothetical protein
VTLLTRRFYTAPLRSLSLFRRGRVEQEFVPLTPAAQTGVTTGRVVTEDGSGLPGVTVSRQKEKTGSFRQSVLGLVAILKGNLDWGQPLFEIDADDAKELRDIVLITMASQSS